MQTSGSKNNHVKECIQRIGKLFSDPHFAANCSSDRELCELLSDGEILCSLLAELSSGRVSHDGALTASYYSKNSVVLARRNLTFFLEQCHQVFKLQDSEVFQPDDLLNMANPEKVVRTVLRVIKANSDQESELESRADSPPQRNSVQLTHLVNEICDHELKLTRKLQSLLQYRNELLGLLSAWSEDLVREVFCYTEKLLAVHVEFHAKLAELASVSCEHFCQQLGGLFCQMEPKLQLYFQYYSRLPAVQKKMQLEFKNSPELMQQIHRLDRHFQASFRSLYEAPIKQPFDYTQLFKRLLTVASKELPDDAIESVQTAVEDLEEFLARANSFKSHAEQLNATKEVLAQMENLPVKLTNPAETGLHQADNVFKVNAVRNSKSEVQPQCLCLLTTSLLIGAKKSARPEALPTFWFAIPLDGFTQVRKVDRCLEILQPNGDKTILEAVRSHSCDLADWARLLEKAKTFSFPRECRPESMRLPTIRCLKCQESFTGAEAGPAVCSKCAQKCSSLQLGPNGQPIGSRLPRRGSAPVVANSWSFEAFYHKSMDRKKAEKLLLTKRQVGTFLLRDSSRGGKAMSVRAEDRVEHIEVVEQSGKYALGNAVFQFDSLESLISHYRVKSLESIFSSMKFCLADGCEAKSKKFSRGRLNTVKE